MIALCSIYKVSFTHFFKFVLADTIFSLLGFPVALFFQAKKA